MFVDCKLSFRTVERQSFLQFCDALRPLAMKALPKQTKLKKLITERARLAITDVHHEISLKVEDGHGVGICVDGWESITKSTLMVLFFLLVEAYAVEFIRGGTEHHAIATEWEELMKRHGEDYPILYHCSDDAGNCARAQWILHLCNPHILFMKCFAHQVSEKLNLEMWCLMDCSIMLCLFVFFLTTFLSRRSISWSELCSRCNRSTIPVTRQSNVQRRSASHQVNGCPF